MGKKLTYEYVKNYIENTGCKLLDDIYVRKCNPLNIECSCGNRFVVSFIDFKEKNMNLCSVCMKSRFRQKMAYSIDEIKKILYDKGYVFLDSEYITCTTKMNIESIDTGYRYFVVLYQVLQYKKLLPFHSNNPHKKYNLQIWIDKICGNILVIDIYYCKNKCAGKIKLRCKVCSEEWEIMLGNFMVYSRCPYCSNSIPGKRNNLYAKFPEVCEDWNYSKNTRHPSEFLPHSNETAWWKCHVCNYEWNTRINSRTGHSQTGCLVCASSKGENKIEKFLIEHKISYKRQYKFDDCKNIRPLPFDFAIFDIENNLFLIEYDGELHYHEYHKAEKSKEKLLKCQENDKIKNEYCAKNNIYLLRIPYWNFKNIENILSEKIKFLNMEYE